MKKLRSLARGKPCVKCGSVVGVVGCHYSGMYSDQLGKGYGIKAKDIFLAYLCEKCHTYFDSYKNKNDGERAAEFMLYILKSLETAINTNELEIYIDGEKLQDLR